MNATDQHQIQRELQRGMLRCDNDIAQAKKDILNRIQALQRYAADAQDALNRGCGSSSFGCLASNICTMAIDIQRAAAVCEQAERLKNCFETASEAIQQPS